MKKTFVLNEKETKQAIVDYLVSKGLIDPWKTNIKEITFLKESDSIEVLVYSEEETEVCITV